MKNDKYYGVETRKSWKLQSEKEVISSKTIVEVLPVSLIRLFWPQLFIILIINLIQSNLIQ